MRHAASLVLTSCLIAACNPSPATLTDSERAAITDSVSVVLDAFWNAWRQADYEAGMSYYLNSPQTIFTGSGVTLHGYDAMFEAFQPAFVGIAQQRMDIDDTNMIVLSPDAVHVSQSGVYSQTDTAGVSGPDIPFSFSTTWVLRDGEWKIITCHQSDRRPASQ